MSKVKLLFILFSFTATLSAQPQASLVPGGIALIELKNYQPGTEVLFNDKRTTLFKNKDTVYALAPIPLQSKPGKYYYDVIRPNKSTQRSEISVLAKAYAEQHLTIKNKRKVNPNQDDMNRIAAERIRKQKAKSHRSGEFASVVFTWPTAGEISSVFGLRRFFNEQERSPHSGIDIAGPEGQTVVAAADGTVLDAGDFFFSGNLVFIDHGQGLISLYAHLSKIDVNPGQYVHRGEAIGAVGMTGRVTGPHLHFSILSNEVAIDPMLLLPKRERIAQR